MPNTGYKGYASIELYFTDDNSSTGVTKANTYGAADYIEPVYDDVSCPVANSTINIDPWVLQFDRYSGSQNVEITSNYDDLSFETGTSWLSVSANGSSGNLTLTISIQYNSTGEVRYIDVNIYQGTEYLASIYVEQSDY